MAKPNLQGKPAKLTRREFLAASAVVPAASLLVTARGQARPDEAPWYATMRRCGQINFNERDPLTLDANAWMDYWASLEVNAVLLNGGGILAYYPTHVPYHHRSQFLGTRDLFGDAVSAAKKRGLRVVARMDCNYAYQEALDAHPEWFERNADGSPRRQNECPWLFQTCMFSAYFTEQMPAIYREINQHYPVDGFFTNGWPSTGALGVCYCENCQKIYREQLGGLPPGETDSSSLLYRKYYGIYMRRIQEVWKLWDSIAKEKSLANVYVGNLGGGVYTVKNLKALAEVAAWFNADHQGRSGNTVLWDCAQQGRVAQSVMNGRTITNVTGAYSTTHPLWRHTSKSAPEITMWLAQTSASGMVPWYHWLGGSPQDNRWRVPGRRFYRWIAQNEPHFRTRRSVASLAVLYPQSTIAFYKSGSGPGAWRGAERGQTADYLNGLYYALIEGRFVFDLVHQENLSDMVLSKYRALLIPNAAYLGDDECAAIRKFAASGGSIFATFETSRYSEWGDFRQDFALSDLFRVSVSGDVIGPVNNSYMRIEGPHPVLDDFQDATILPGPESRVPVRKLGGEALVLTVIPSYPSFPPEMVYPRVDHTNQPAAIFYERGPARVAYFPGDIDRTFWRSGNTDLSRLIQNTVRWVLGGGAQPVTVSGHGVVEIFAWETEPGYALHILNYTNPNMTRGELRKFYPIGAQKVAFEVAEGRKIASVRALRAGRNLEFNQNAKIVQFEVPSVVDYEVVALT